MVAFATKIPQISSPASSVTGCFTVAILDIHLNVLATTTFVIPKTLKITYCSEDIFVIY